ncbi:MAG: NADH oxidase [Sphingomonadales bacterium]|nr:MAG: NADH oxidase [Sphingomonadales bacterium]
MVTNGLELRSTVSGDGKLRVALDPVTLDAPGPDEVVVQIEATPINPSDLALLLGPVDMDSLKVEDGALTGTILPARMRAMQARAGQALPVGNEGAGTVIAAGENAQGLLGKRVGMIGGAMFATHRKLPVRDCIPLPDGATAADGASMFVNPLTALAFVETFRSEGHKAMIHTAAASNLGQMLNRICQADGVPLINIVRSEAQAQILRDLGAKYIIDSTAPDFRETLTEAVAETGATLAFDAIGGGAMANTILHAMETAEARKLSAYNRYGSSTHKQLYIYGMLDTGPTTLDRGYGFAWSVSGFLLTPFLMKAGMETIGRLRARVAAELTTTFASHYSKTISLADVLDPAIAAQYNKKATGEKFLIDPSR